MSNLFHFDGRLASAPETRHYGETSVTKFTLIRNEYAGKDGDGKAKQRTVSVQFTTFNGIGDRAARPQGRPADRRCGHREQQLPAGGR